ncbi:hypothetical protein GOODEAATRI_020652 [Goodea atripinnis]|uniref:Uncharacterized protein n=1 Tax=Goodea atripinnis TaxID=208336 RepID=A0ABV0N310_9TELE
MVLLGCLLLVNHQKIGVKDKLKTLLLLSVKHEVNKDENKQQKKMIFLNFPYYSFSFSSCFCASSCVYIANNTMVRHLLVSSVDQNCKLKSKTKTPSTVKSIHTSQADICHVATA